MGILTRMYLLCLWSLCGVLGSCLHHYWVGRRVEVKTEVEHELLLVNYMKTENFYETLCLNI